ncbi:MAG: hypothetical protein J0H15_02780 [Xanthomonadales bacterium]|nr:hypothetical protein [Xanthomonadales bacterium]
MTTEALKPLVAVVAAALLLALAGCTNTADPDNVDRRAVERWNYLIEHKAEQAYDYLSPGFRTTQTREDYAAAMNNRPVQWKEARFKSKECEEERCKVEVEVGYAVPLAALGGKPTTASSNRSEVWILVDNHWYYLPSH